MNIAVANAECAVAAVNALLPLLDALEAREALLRRCAEVLAGMDIASHLLDDLRAAGFGEEPTP